MNQTEEEQIIAVKNLWQQYGRWLMIVVVVSLLFGSGWAYWQQQQNIQADAASQLFQSMSSAYEETQKADAKPEPQITLKTLGEQIIKDHPKTVYAQFAALMLAKQAVLAKQLLEAKQHLQWVIDRAKDEALLMTAYQRLARVTLAMQDYAATEQVLEKMVSPGFSAAKAEIKADMFYQQGKLDQARTEYQAALQSEDNRRVFVELKRDDIAN
jgi:predicted negative regulator of RcsB-dependent stress response